MNHYVFCQLRPVGRSGRPWEAEIALPTKCLMLRKGRRVHQTPHLRRFMSHRKWRISPKSVFYVFLRPRQGQRGPNTCILRGFGLRQGQWAPKLVFYKMFGPSARAEGPHPLYSTKLFGLRKGRMGLKSYFTKFFSIRSGRKDQKSCDTSKTVRPFSEFWPGFF